MSQMLTSKKIIDLPKDLNDCCLVDALTVTVPDCILNGCCGGVTSHKSHIENNLSSKDV